MTANQLLHHEPRTVRDAQARAVTERIAAVEDLFRLAELTAHQAASLPDLLRSLTLVQQQVHAARKAVIVEARTTGFDDAELAAILRLNIEDFVSRYPYEQLRAPEPHGSLGSPFKTS